MFFISKQNLWTEEFKEFALMLFDYLIYVFLNQQIHLSLPH